MLKQVNDEDVWVLSDAERRVLRTAILYTLTMHGCAYPDVLTDVLTKVNGARRIEVVR